MTLLHTIRKTRGGEEIGRVTLQTVAGGSDYFYAIPYDSRAESASLAEWLTKRKQSFQEKEGQPFVPFDVSCAYANRFIGWLIKKQIPELPEKKADYTLQISPEERLIFHVEHTVYYTSEPGLIY